MIKAEECHQRTCNFRRAFRRDASLFVRRTRTVRPLSNCRQSSSAGGPTPISTNLLGAFLVCCSPSSSLSPSSYTMGSRAASFHESSGISSGRDPDQLLADLSAASAAATRPSATALGSDPSNGPSVEVGSSCAGGRVSCGRTPLAGMATFGHRHSVGTSVWRLLVGLRHLQHAGHLGMKGVSCG